MSYILNPFIYLLSDPAKLLKFFSESRQKLYHRIQSLRDQEWIISNTSDIPTAPNSVDFEFKSLRFENVYISDQMLERLTECSFHSITNILCFQNDLGTMEYENDMPPLRFKSFCQFVSRQCPQTRYLSIIRNNLSDVYLLDLYSLILTLKNLKRVSLCWNNFSSKILIFQQVFAHVQFDFSFNFDIK